MIKGFKLMFMFLAMTALALSSCGKDDKDDDNALKTAVVGKWKITDISTGISVVDNLIGTAKESLLSEMFPSEYHEFSSDKTYTRTRNAKIVEKGTYTTSGSGISITYKEVEDGVETGNTKTKTMKVQVDGDKLTWSDKYSTYAQYFTGMLESYASLLENVSLKITLAKQ